MIDFNRLKDIILEEAKGAGLEQYEIYYKSVRDVSTETLKDEISGFSSGESGGVCFRCIVGGRMGYASSELMEPNEMRELVARAVANASYIENDDEVFIYSGDAKYGQKTSPPHVMPDTALMMKNALELQRDMYSRSEYVTDGTQTQIFAYETETYIVNSAGLELHNSAGMSGGYAGAVVKVNGEPADAAEVSLGHDIETLLPLSDRAVGKALAKIGAGEVASGKYDIIIQNRQMRSILSAFSSVFSGKSARLGLSLLAGREGCAVAAECVTVRDNPFNPNCPVQTTFDAEGVAVYPKNIIEDGLLKTLLYDLTNAKIAGVLSTGNAAKSSYADTVGIRPFCLSIEPGQMSYDSLLMAAGDGILISEIKGLHAGANGATGDFSVECAGFMIEEGKATKPVKSFTIAGNFYCLMRDIVCVADDVYYGMPTGYTNFASPSVLVRSMSVAGK